MTGTAWLYAVVSSDQQADTLESQVNWGRSTAAANGWQITKEWKGVSSGVSGTRKLLQDLIAELRSLPKSQRPQRLLMVRLDRLGRGDGFETISAFSEIRNLGLVVSTRDDGDVTVTKASDAILPVIKSVVAAIENEVRADRVRAGHARRRAEGKHSGTVPFGVVLVDGRATAYEPEAVIVREIYELLAKGWGYGRIARFIAQRALSKRLSNGSPKLINWSPSTVRSLFVSQTIREVVVDEELAQRAEATRTMAFRERSPKRHPWPLAGAVRCTCGKVLAGHVGGNEPNQIRYYYCRWHILEKGQLHPAHRAAELEVAFIDLLRELTADPDIMLGVDAKRSTEAVERKREQLREHDKNLERRRQRAWDIAEEAGIDSKHLKKRLDEIDHERAATQKEIERLNGEIEHQQRGADCARSLISILKELVEYWPVAPLEVQQGCARAVSALREVGGLWAAPEYRGKLLTGNDVAKLQLCDHISRIGTAGQISAVETLASLLPVAPGRHLIGVPIPYSGC